MSHVNSILSYKIRGKWGKSSYRGNCSGYVIKDLLEFFRPQKFVEVFSGGGTGKDVAQELGITNSVHLDLNNGWNALVDEIPTGSDFVFSHPPYWDIICYQEYNGHHPDDLSLNMSYEEFIYKLNKVNLKIYQSLLTGGRHAFLIGDVRKKGKYYSIIKDMAWFGDLEVHIIKQQHNTFSSRKTYANNNFIPIAHEHLLIFKKNAVWCFPLKLTKTHEFSLLNIEQMTWRDLIQGALEYLGGESSLKEIYEVLQDSKKAKKNQHWKEKIRQTLQIHENFENVSRGIWKLKIA